MYEYVVFTTETKIFLEIFCASQKAACLRWAGKWPPAAFFACFGLFARYGGPGGAFCRNREFFCKFKSLHNSVENSVETVKNPAVQVDKGVTDGLWEILRNNISGEMGRMGTVRGGFSPALAPQRRVCYNACMKLGHFAPFGRNYGDKKTGLRQRQYFIAQGRGPGPQASGRDFRLRRPGRLRARGI
ncbi:hypothetical protein [uncultured Oscillibacter sp.]|uniref:hypothetical protein n=1 Tax=uncultured Oscillibacter sp. TaxID=876091 RepID=UPI00280BBAF6|nr:hypothetical protein [uncultured Oscillibacter sp.]